MNWQKVILAGLAGGVALWLYDFLMYGIVLGSEYEKYQVFSQVPANPLLFLLVEVLIGLGGALMFAKTRSVWGAGIMAGVTFGLFMGIPAFFPSFINHLIFVDFPYHMAWSWGAISLVGWIVFGAVASLIYK